MLLESGPLNLIDKVSGIVHVAIGIVAIPEPDETAIAPPGADTTRAATSINRSTPLRRCTDPAPSTITRSVTGTFGTHPAPDAFAFFFELFVSDLRSQVRRIDPAAIV